jgi:regulator of sigma E protease
MSWSAGILAVLGLALLMVIHESGHHFVARAFGMRVLRFSIGFGPALWRHQPRGSATVYQVALIPFLAYVQIAGMNPFEEVDPDDKGSYANASLTARIATVVAGPFANYFFASFLFFGAYWIGGDSVPTTTIQVVKDTPAARANMKDGDKVLDIDGTAITDFEQMRQIILKHPNQPIELTVLRDGKRRTLQVTPKPNDAGDAQIGVGTVPRRVDLTFKQAVIRSVVEPADVVVKLVYSLARIITAKDKPELSGPVGIVKITGNAAEVGIDRYLWVLGVLSAYLGGFNLLPVPALDGGRLMFLGYEAITRRRANARVEAHVHALGLLMLLTLIAVVTVFDIKGN